MQVGLGIRNLAEIGNLYPLEILTFDHTGATRFYFGKVGMHLHRKVTVGMFDGNEEFTDLGVDTELFFQLAHDALLNRFADLLLAAGEFP